MCQSTILYVINDEIYVVKTVKYIQVFKEGIDHNSPPPKKPFLFKYPFSPP